MNPTGSGIHVVCYSDNVKFDIKGSEIIEFLLPGSGLFWENLGMTCRLRIKIEEDSKTII